MFFFKIKIWQQPIVNMIVKLLSQTPAEEFDETMFTTEWSNSLVALFYHANKKTICIGV